MAGSSFGTLFKITTWGESHGDALGVIIDGCPAGLSLCEEDIQVFLDRRKPGQSKFTTRRSESDQAHILSGVFEGKTTGTPISILVYNKDHHSKDYSNIMNCYRPGHADFPFDAKYGIRDYRGGGRSSGRETIGRVAAGAVASKMLKELGVTVMAYTKGIGPVSVPENAYDFSAVQKNTLYMPSESFAKQAEEYLASCMEQGDSSGGVIECQILGLPAGIGETVFDKLDASLAKAFMSIGAVKGVEIGKGFAVASMKGSENNDPFYMDEGKVCKKTNHSGGTLGGLSDGSSLIIRAAVKPTPSIGSVQQTVTKDGKDTSITIHGRHDPVIVPRAVVVAESMAAITVLDQMMINMSAKAASLINFYS